MSRYDNFHRIQQLDPVRDNCQICHLIAGYEFPWDVTRALEIALFRTFCVPSISELLDKTGEFHHRTQKRYDDTGLLVAEIMKWGYDSQRGADAIRRINQIHGHFKISNQDFLYVLSTFLYEPVRWIAQFGWRPHPSPQLRRVVANALKLRGQLLRLLPPRKKPDFYVDAPQRSYPQGYELTDLGPPHMLESLNRQEDPDTV